VTSTKFPRWKPRYLLDEQIAFDLANIVENNQAFSAVKQEIYRELITDIRANSFNNR
jgi:hypothetical protein